MKALGNKEHPSQTRVIGYKVPWKKGFPQDLHKYKCRRNAEQRRIEEFKAAFKEMYEENKKKEREEQENLAVPSNAGSVDQAEPFGKFPVDAITGPTRCK